MKRRLVMLSLVLLGIAVFVLPARAQRFAFAQAGGGRAIGPMRGHGGGGFARGGRGRYFAGAGFYPHFYPDYYSDYDSEGFESLPPPMVVAQSAEPAASPQAPSPVEPLVIELQGDHWVQVKDYGVSQTGAAGGQPGAERAANLPNAIDWLGPRRAQSAEPTSELPSAVLIFRDGHREEIGKYVIVGGTIYARADYWSSGSWTRKVDIAQLDVPATLKLNQDRGAKFNLPSGPNEVMIRP